MKLVDPDAICVPATTPSTSPALDPAPAQQFLLRRQQHFFRGQRLVAHHRLHAPQQVQAIAHRQRPAEGIDFSQRAVLRDQNRSIPGLGEYSNRAHVKIFGGVRDGFANRLRNRKAALLAASRHG